MNNSTPSNRILIWVGIVFAVLIAIAATLNATREVTLDPDTPEGVVQLFVTAYLDGDEAVAMKYLTDDQVGQCNKDPFPRYRDDSARVALLDTQIDDSTAEVEVRVTEGSAGIFDSTEYSHEERFTLESSSEGWLISGLSWPWHLCLERISP